MAVIALRGAAAGGFGPITDEVRAGERIRADAPAAFFDALAGQGRLEAGEISRARSVIVRAGDRALDGLELEGALALYAAAWGRGGVEEAVEKARGDVRLFAIARIFVARPELVIVTCALEERAERLLHEAIGEAAVVWTGRAGDRTWR